MDDRLLRAICAQTAEQMWDSFDENERTTVRFGMFPAAKMQQAEAEIIAGNGDPLPPQAAADVGRLLAVALMDQASRNGGMCA